MEPDTRMIGQPDQRRLFFDLSAILGYQIHLVVHGWQAEQPLHWFSHDRTSVIARGSFLEAPGLPVFTLEDEDGGRLSDQIPLKIARVAQFMPAIDFELCQACAASDKAYQLAVDAPLLFILLVDFARKNFFSVHKLNQILALKRTDILRHIGLPGSRSLARLIRRIRLSTLLPWELGDVSQALRNSEVLAVLRHHPRLHLNHLRFVLRLGQPIEPCMLNLIDEHSSAQDINWVRRMILDTRNLARGNERAIAGIASRQSLQEVHDRLVERFNRDHGKDPAAYRGLLSERLKAEHGDYPSIPVPAIDGIEPLCSWLELLEEGARMHHCVGSYDIHVAHGDVFIYRMVQPERLTISLEKKNNEWIVGEVRGYCNASPSAKALEIVRRWVEC